MKKLSKIHIFVLLVCLFTPFIFSGCENSNKDSLSTPAFLQVAAGEIIFDPVTDAEYYTISINNTEINVDVKHNNNVQIINNRIYYDASKIFVVGESYSIKIRANSSEKVNSMFSSVVSYKHNGSITTPTDVKINGTTLTWGMVEGASYYLVKVLTPNDLIVFDKNGNVLTLDDPASISKADLTEYSFNANSFDFSSLLSKAGTYQFYVCAVLSNGSSYVESSYTSKVSYNHYELLEKPVCGEVFNINNNLHLAVAVDKNANEIAVKCNGTELITALNNQQEHLLKLSDNYFDINLTELFAGKLDFSDLKQISVAVQSRYSTNNPETEFYTNSSFSNDVFYENAYNLNAPTLTLENFETSHIASWSFDQADKISGYRLVLFTDNGIIDYYLTAETNTMILSEEFIAVAVQAIEKGELSRSEFSNIVAMENLQNFTEELSYETVGSSISWSHIDGTYYVVDFNNELYVLDEPNFKIPTSNLKTNNFSIRIHTIKNGFAPMTTQVDLSLSSKLATPTFGPSQGFTSSTLYELTFTGVENAIGYYVHIKSASAEEFEKISILYTSTKINLSNYICSKGEYTDYLVKVQAVADHNGICSDSDLSSAISVAHKQVLDTPEFYKVGDTTYPVIKEISDSTIKYYLQFNGVRDANSYEVLINFNKLTIQASNQSLYKIDITNYLSSANTYEIKIRAIPQENAINVEPSEYVTTTYTLTKQLKSAENIKVTENDGIYTLSFDPVDNAETYRVRIVKENDSSYVDYLNSLGLSISFEVSPSQDISQYVQQQGNYYFYITALAPKGSYYADANESSTFGTLNKLTSLVKPSEIEFENISKDLFVASWNGDDNADYYLIKITDPNGISFETKIYKSTSANINQYITIQGTYKIDIYSMVETLGETAKEYTSSSATSTTLHHTYKLKQDFLRHSISMYGNSYNFIVANANDLKNLLWYHYLYEIDEGVGLRMMIELQEKEAAEPNSEVENLETLREAIIRLSNDATISRLHDFNNDETWLNKLDASTDSELFSYLCTKLLSIYPEFNILSGFKINNHFDGNIFELVYKNSLNGEKITYTNNDIQINKNYGNEYNYIDPFLRKSATGVFNIDSRQKALVTTSEQLLRVVQDGFKPAFIGDCETAETIYSNAKLVLSTIVTNNMSDLEKVTAIFDWIEAEFDLVYYKDTATFVSGSIEFGGKDNSALAKYGQYEHYYLEGIFKNISMTADGTLVIGNKYATSHSYSKAFALLCAIEGINSYVINGSYSYVKPSDGTTVLVDHAWNKVYVDKSSDQKEGKSWFSIDLTFSDNRIYFNNLDKGYGMSAHTYFLTSDSYTPVPLKNFKNESILISQEYVDKIKNNDLSYDYYANSNFGLTLNQMDSTISGYKLYKRTCENCSYEHISYRTPTVCPNCSHEDTFNGAATLVTSGFKYSKKFDSQNTVYQEYANKELENGESTNLGDLKSFYVNLLIHAGYMENNNESGRSVVEFKLNSELFDLNELIQAFTILNSYNLELERGQDSQGNGTIYTVEDTANATTIVVCIIE